MTAAELIKLGKSSVEAELARIESDLESAKTLAQAKSAVLVSALQSHLDIHTAEAATATALIARASAVVIPVVEGIITNSVPAATLTLAEGKIAKVGAWLNKQGWKGGALVGILLVVGHYLLGKVF